MSADFDLDVTMQIVHGHSMDIALLKAKINALEKAFVKLQDENANLRAELESEKGDDS